MRLPAETVVRPLTVAPVVMLAAPPLTFNVEPMVELTVAAPPETFNAPDWVPPNVATPPETLMLPESTANAVEAMKLPSVIFVEPLTEPPESVVVPLETSALK